MIASPAQTLFKPTATQISYIWFCRFISMICVWSGLLYWLRLIGFDSDSLWRFDLMPTHWQVAAVCLAVLYPIAAVGLWLVASWGPVIWFICAIAEIIMHSLYPSLFGRRDLLVMTHILVMAAFIVLRTSLYLHRRAERRAT